MIIYYSIITVFYLILLFLVRNIYDHVTNTYYYAKEQKYESIYSKEDKLKLPIWAYMLFTLLIYIPMLGIFIIILLFVWLILDYVNEHLYFNNKYLEKQNWFKFLNKKI